RIARRPFPARRNARVLPVRQLWTSGRDAVPFRRRPPGGPSTLRRIWMQRGRAFATPGRDPRDTLRRQRSCGPLDHAVDGARELAPLFLPLGQPAKPFRRELVDAPAAAVPLRPPARQ